MRRTLLLPALLLLALSGAAAQGISLDIKTRLTEKNELIALKHGVISAIERAGVWDVVEFGEDYSLWLTDLQRSERGTAMHSVQWRRTIHRVGPRRTGR